MLLAALPVTAATQGQTAALSPDRGKFRIVLQGRTVGTENFTIAREAGGWSIRSTIQLDLPGEPRETDTAELMLATAGSPLRYRWQGHSAGTRSIEVEFHGDAAEMTLRRPASAPAIDAFSFPAGHVVLLDNNVYAQYDILAQLYDWKTGGRQKFSVLIPQAQTPGTVIVESLGKRVVSGAKLDLLSVKSPDLEVDLYVDSARRLMLLRVPGSGAEIIRE